MRYMMFIKQPTRDYDPSQVPPALYGAMGEFVGEQIKNGMFIDGAGLQPLTKATRVKLARGKTAPDSRRWYQVAIGSAPVSISSRTRVGVRPIADEPHNSACSRGDTVGHTVLSELYIKSDSWDGSDFLATRELVGLRRGLLAPHPLMLMSARARKVLAENSLTDVRRKLPTSRRLSVLSIPLSRRAFEFSRETQRIPGGLTFRVSDYR